MLKNSGTRLFTAFLGYAILIILLLTLNPFYFSLPGKIFIKMRSSRLDLIQNLLLFLPVGFFYRMTTGRRDAFLLGATLSFGIETLQLFIPARTTNFIDFLANTLSAGLGAGMYDLFSRQITLTSGTVSRFRLETPLMGLTYMLLPLLWSNTLALDESPYHWLLSLLIGICGAIILSELFRHWWERVNSKIMVYASLAAGVWFLLGAGLGMLRFHSLWLVGLSVMVLTAILTTLPRRLQERRFEQNTLRRLLPVFVIYLLALALGAQSRPFGPWHAYFGLTDRVTDESLYLLNSRIEYLAAFTVLGYLIAEWRGRLELSLSRDLPRLLLMASAAALLFEILSGFQRGQGASLVRFILAVLGAGFGGLIYHLSRDQIRHLLDRTSRIPPAA
ncbi:MAG: VanZ family protein [Bacteroidota bacterium]